jgi:ADP-dependent NAD(P)H-hydrate dehydratase / NAD(P)H-hydrate epimerase
VIPVLFPDEMRNVDEAAPVSKETLIQRAGHCVAREAIAMLGGAYGKRVIVVAGPGANGADGRVAAELLRRRGVRVDIVNVSREVPPPVRLARADLVIDAAYGTSLRGPYVAPDTMGALVLSVDIPSGLDPSTGLVADPTIAVRADVTVTFAGMKPGLLLGDGPIHAGRIVVADIGLDPTGYCSAAVMERSDVAAALPTRDRSAHKWDSAVLVVAGSLGMTGAPVLVSQGALRAGAGMVRLAVPGQSVDGSEAVTVALPLEQWTQSALEQTERCHALVIGPGLGRERTTRAAIRQMLSRCALPTVIDADAIIALAPGTTEIAGYGANTDERRNARADDPAVTNNAVTNNAVGNSAVRNGTSRGVSGAVRPPNVATSTTSTTSATSATTSKVATIPDVPFASAGTVNRAIAAAGGLNVGGDLPPGQRAVLQAAARRLGATPTAVAAAGTAHTAEFDSAVRGLAGRAPGTTVLTPHVGEFRALTGQAVSADRIGDVRRLAAATGAVVLLKGPTTIIAAPDGWVNIVVAGDQRLATAGTGDVLAGVIGALLALGLSTMSAASVGAWLHGTAASTGYSSGLIAGDLPELVAELLSSFSGGE